VDSRPAGKLLVDLGTAVLLSSVEEELGAVDFPVSACVVLAFSFCGAGALRTVLFAIGNANKPAASSIKREIETIAVSL
jgi:hypothetical protein